MTYRECAIIEAFTGYTMLTGDKRYLLYRYVEEIMGRPILTHELILYANEIGIKAREDFIELCENATDEEESET